MSEPAELGVMRASIEIRPYRPKGRAGDRDPLGCEILVNGVTILRWSGDGIGPDEIETEDPKRVFPTTTTPHWRCLRMIFEQQAAVILSAITDGPSGTGLSQARPLSIDEELDRIGWLLEDIGDDARSVSSRILETIRQREAGRG